MSAAMEVDGHNRLRTRTRVAAYVLWDHLVRPKATQAHDVPWSVDAITPGWLTAVLCGSVPGARVECFEQADGDSGSTVRQRLELTYDEVGTAAGLPEQVFVKHTPTLLTRLASGLAGSVEARFYTDLRSELDIEAPHLLHTAQDRTSGRSMHLFDDVVATRGAVFNRFHTRLGREHLDQAVDTLATLHGTYYDSRRLEDELRWVPTYEGFVKSGERAGTRSGHEQAMDRCLHVVPKVVADRRDEIWPTFMRNLALHRRNPRTLIHSDVHLGNWYVTATGRVGLADWQVLERGHWARDLAYAVSTLCDEADRGHWERDLLERYLDRMRSTCSLRIGFDQAWDAYRSQMVGALLMWTPTLVHPATMPDMQPEEMSMLMIRRTTVAIAELETLDVEVGA
jgi:hypothetical protein